MKWAIQSLLPAFFSAVVLTFLIHRPIHLAMIWITLYGLALLATQHFAPRSLIVLGVTFFLTGCGLMPRGNISSCRRGHLEPSALVVSGIMAATFGGYHLAYAAAIWALGEDRDDSRPSTIGSEDV